MEYQQVIIYIYIYFGFQVPLNLRIKVGGCILDEKGILHTQNRLQSCAHIVCAFLSFIRRQLGQKLTCEARPLPLRLPELLGTL